MGRSSWGKAGAAQAPGTPGDHELAKGKKGPEREAHSGRSPEEGPRGPPLGALPPHLHRPLIQLLAHPTIQLCVMAKLRSF